MIKWQSKFGHSITIEFQGYEFPEENEDYDANWVVVKIAARNENASWSRISACLFTWDILRLALWLDKVIVGDSEFEYFIAMDTDLEIQYIATSAQKHAFAIVLRPGLSISDDDCDIVFVSVGNSELAETKKYLGDVFSTFPPRGDVGRVNLKVVEKISQNNPLKIDPK